MTIKEIRSAIENITDLSRGKTLKELKAIKHIGINDEKDCVILLIEIGKKGTEVENILRRELAKVVKMDLGYSGIKIQFEESKEASNIAGKNTKFILVSGSKGGCGKSTIAINLAYTLKEIGKSVGILDADIYSYNIPIMLNMESKTPNVDLINKIIPYEKDGIQVISTYFFSQEDSPLLWKGNMLTSMINNFLFQVSWKKDLDYLIIDCPNGTGDVIQDLGEALPDSKVIVVTDEDRTSAITALKSIKAHEELHQKVLGYVITKYSGNEFASIFLKEKTNNDLLATISFEKKMNSYLYENKDNKDALMDIANILLLEE